MNTQNILQVEKLPLTREKWDEWNNVQPTTHHDLDPSYVYSEIHSSPVLRDYFLSLPEFSKQNIRSEIQYGQRGVELGAVAGLMIRLTNSRTTIHTKKGEAFSAWLNKNHDNVFNAIYDTPRNDMSADFVIQVERFCQHQTSFETDHRTWSHYYEIAAYMLKVIYDEKRIVEVILEWRKKAIRLYSIQDFINLVDNWHQREKFEEMPFEWMMNMIEEKYDD